jgi:large subunit ribosomal protein L4
VNSELIGKNDWNNALIVDGETVSRNLELASSNLKSVEVLPSGDINVYKILKHDVLMLSLDCVKYLETVYFKEMLENKASAHSL